jgi:hypothetical protein
MTDEKLNELEAVCSAEADKDGKVKLFSSDVLALVSELRELRKHAADLCAHEGAIANLHRLLAHLSSYAVSPPGDELTASGRRIAVQDPGR